MLKIELTSTREGKHFYKLIDESGKVLLLSEGYEQKDKALNGIELLKNNALSEENIELKTSTTGLYYISLKTSNGQVIGNSTNFKNHEFSNHLIRRIAKEAPDSEIIEIAY